MTRRQPYRRRFGQNCPYHASSSPYLSIILRWKDGFHGVGLERASPYRGASVQCIGGGCSGVWSKHRLDRPTTKVLHEQELR